MKSGNFKGALLLALITGALLTLDISLFSVCSLTLASTLPSYPVVSLKTGENYFWFEACSLRVELPAVPIMCGTETGYSLDLTPREPWPMLYGVGEYPPVGAAEMVDNGRVIALGGLPILRSAPVNQFGDTRLAAGKLMPLIVRWLIDWGNPREHKFLFQYRPPAIFPDITDTMAAWLGLLKDELGFNLTIQEWDWETITPELLENYDVIQIVGLVETLTSSERQAIADWVEHGGGLLLMEQGDYAGSGLAPASNKILETIGCHIRFQDDEVYDNEHWTKDGPWYPQVYLLDVRSVNPKFDVWSPDHAFDAEIINPVVNTYNSAAYITLNVTNQGTQTTTYKVEVGESTAQGWSYDVRPSEIEISSKENGTVVIVVAVPAVLSFTSTEWTAKVTDKTRTFLTENKIFRVIGDPALRRMGVEISISPAYQENKSGGTLAYAVTVTNTGNVDDTYELSVSDNAGWGARLDDNALAVLAGDNRVAILSVTIPSDAIESEMTRITVIARSQADPTVENSAWCTATATGAPAEEISPLVYVGIAVVIVVIIAAVLIMKPF